MFSFQWNGFLLEIAQALEMSEVYIVTKALSMKLPQILPWFWLVMLIVLCVVCAGVLCGKKAGDVEMSEVYIVTKALSMKLPQILPWFWLVMLIVLCVVCAGVLCGKKAGDVIGASSSERGIAQHCWYPFALAVLFVWSLISMTGVSEYLYFSF